MTKFTGSFWEDVVEEAHKKPKTVERVTLEDTSDGSETFEVTLSDYSVDDGDYSDIDEVEDLTSSHVISHVSVINDTEDEPILAYIEESDSDGVDYDVTFDSSPSDGDDLIIHMYFVDVNKSGTIS